MILVEQFKKCFPRNSEPEEWTEAINQMLPKYEINSQLRVIHFLTQWGHETAGFTRLVENLNYDAAGLLRTWPKRFNAESAKEYAHNPQAIASKVYANRLGNGTEESGDGWTYRGRGAQITGKDNCKAFAKAIGRSLDMTIDYLMTKAGAIESACWFWDTRKLNAIADADDVEELTRRINGGLIGLDDRKELAARIGKVFS